MMTNLLHLIRKIEIKSDEKLNTQIKLPNNKIL